MKLSELADAPYNPRIISEEALNGLTYSIDAFGDLSCIVFNRQTGNIVCGHQRKKALQAKYGDLEIVEVENNEGYIETPTNERFRVRFVDWELEKEQAANILANSPTIQGEFTTDVVPILEHIQTDMPELFEQTMLFDLLPTQETDIIMPDEHVEQSQSLALQPPTLRHGDIVQFNEHTFIVGDLKRDVLSELYHATNKKATLTLFDMPKWTKGKFSIQQTTDEIKSYIEDVSKSLTFITGVENSRIIISSQTYTVSRKEKTRKGISTVKTETYMSPYIQQCMFALGYELIHHRFFVHQPSLKVEGDRDEVGGQSKIVQTFSQSQSEEETQDDALRIESEVQTYISSKSKSKAANFITAYWRDQRIWQDEPVNFFKRLLLLYTKKRDVVFDAIREKPFYSFFSIAQCDRIFMGCIKEPQTAEFLLSQYAQTVKDIHIKGINREINFDNILNPKNNGKEKQK